MSRVAFSSGFPRGLWPSVCSLGAVHGQKAALSLKMRGGDRLETPRAAWPASFSAASKCWNLPDADGTALGFYLKDSGPFPAQGPLVLSVCSNPNKARASSWKEWPLLGHALFSHLGLRWLLSLGLWDFSRGGSGTCLRCFWGPHSGGGTSVALSERFPSRRLILL